MKRNSLAWGALIVISIVIIAIYVVPLRLFDPRNSAQNPQPQVIPALREWQGGSGVFTLNSASRIVIDQASGSQLRETATTFQTDLLAVSGRTLPIVTTTRPVLSDLFLTLHTADQGLGAEGYRLQIADSLVISARTPTGIFYATRTVLQILRQDPDKIRIPQGDVRDFPQYKVRGFMLDVGRRFFSLAFLEDYVRFMAWYKMDDLHLHLNDNALGGGDVPDWQHSYAAFRLNSPRFPGLAAKDGSYTREDLRELQDVARTYHVTITPEIDAPAHALALTQYRPDLASPQYSKEFLDLNNPASLTFVNSLWDEFLPWFDTSEVDIGADEYAVQDADKYRQFVNACAAYLEHKGKTVRMWGSLSEMASPLKIDPHITIDVWNNRWSNPVDMSNAGFQIINSIDSLLYIVPKAGYYHDYLDSQLLYDKWEPYIFDLNNPALNLKPNDPHLEGAVFALWNDRLNIITDEEAHSRIQPAMIALSQKLWHGTDNTLSYANFQGLTLQIGEAPGTYLPQPVVVKLAPQSFLLPINPGYPTRPAHLPQPEPLRLFVFTRLLKMVN